MNPDAIIVGSGPNGLAAAIALAKAGLKTQVLEAKETPGGGVRSSDNLTLPGFVHDICSAFYPMGAGSPFFQRLNLEQYGLRWITPPVQAAHPLDDGTAALLYRSVPETAGTLGPDNGAYESLMGPLAKVGLGLMADFLGPVLRFPVHPIAYARFGLEAMRSMTGLARSRFSGDRAPALLAGIAVHATIPLDVPFSAAFGLTLALAGHAVGWPFPRGGAGDLTRSLVACLEAHGGAVQTNAPVTSLDDLPPARMVLLDITARQFLQMAGDRLPEDYRQKLEKYRYGPGVFKVDWALDAPVPWKAIGCAGAGTVHLGGTIEEVAQSEADTWEGRVCDRPFVLFGQHSLFDDTRAPAGKHTGWAYCHVPNGSNVDMTGRIEAQLERFAPGFQDRILSRSVRGPAALEEYNPNLIGGEIGGGAVIPNQLFTRPIASLNPYSTPLPGVYLCSSSTPPGPGVHGMCGYFAAQAALHWLKTRRRWRADES